MPPEHGAGVVVVSMVASPILVVLDGQPGLLFQAFERRVVLLAQLVVLVARGAVVELEERGLRAAGPFSCSFDVCLGREREGGLRCVQDGRVQEGRVC